MAHDDIVGETALAGDEAGRPGLGGKAHPLALDRGQRQRAHEAHELRLADQRVIGQGVPALGQMRMRHVADMLDDALLLHDAQVLQRDGGGDRMAGIGIAVVEFIGSDGRRHLVADDGPANRRVAGRQTLGDGHDMRLDAEGLAAEPVAGAAEAGDDLVGDQEDPVFVDDALDLGPIGRGRDDHAARALNGLGDEGRDLLGSDLKDLVLQRPGAGDPEFLGRHLAALQIPIGLVDMDDAGNGQHPLLVHRDHAAEAGAAHGRAVVAVLAGDDDLPLGLFLQGPVMADEADVGVIRLGPRACEEHMVQIARRQFGDAGGQRDGGHMRGLEEGVVIGKLADLAGGGLGDFLAGITDVDAPEPGHAVDDLLALAVLQPDALGLGDDPRALPGQFVIGGEGMHVMRGVQRLQLGGGQMIGDRTHGGNLLRPGQPGDSPQDTQAGRRPQRDLIKLLTPAAAARPPRPRGFSTPGPPEDICRTKIMVNESLIGVFALQISRGLRGAGPPGPPRAPRQDPRRSA